jgi:lysophospholipase L1-like esterase
MRRFFALLTCALGLAACSTVQPPSPPPGARYVAMGSSFAAGPGVTTSADSPPDRCARSNDNYARQLARRRGLTLVDVSCSGATTQALLKPWGKIPAQLDALTPDTALVTITIGGNDVGYIGGLMAASCRTLAKSSGACPPARAPSEADFQKLRATLLEIVAEVRRRAPGARLVFVDYPAVLPERGVCAATAVDPAEAQAWRAVARRLAETTAEAARAGGAEVLKASVLSRGHDACAPEPWMNGFQQPGAPRIAAPYHPNLAGMTAVAEGLDRLLRR